MNTTAFRNIHVQPAAPATEQDATSRCLPRLRLVTNDPAREYEQRPGEVERLPDSVASLILSKQGFSKVTRNGVIVEGVGPKPLKFWCESSVTITEKAGTNEKVLWTLNRQQPDVLHILTPDGEYIESIPLDGKVPWFDEKATASVLGAKTRANNRRVERVRALHAPDSEAALDAATHNEAEIRGVVQTFPAGRQDSRTVATHRDGTGQDRIGPQNGREHSFTRAERLHQVQQHLDSKRNGHTARQREIAERVAEVTDRDLDDLADDERCDEAVVIPQPCAADETEEPYDDVL